MPVQVGQAQVNKKKLLVLASTYPRWQGDHEPGFVHELSRRLTDDFEVTVICPSAPGTKHREILDGVSVSRYRYAPASLETLVNDGGIVSNLKSRPWKWLLLPGFLLGQLWAVWRAFRQSRPDVVHAHWLLPQGLVVALLSLVAKKPPPVLVTSHGADLFALRSRPLTALKRFVARKSQGVAVVSKAMRDEASKQAISDTAWVMPMGVDIERRFSPARHSEPDRNQLLFVGRLVEKKGVHLLIEAFARLKRDCPDAQLKIVGFGPEKTKLEALVRDLGLSKEVCFSGPTAQSELPDLYRNAGVFVAPFIEAASGDQEGLGLVVVEALGCGCPVVLSDMPAARDAVEGISGIETFPVGNVAALAVALKRVIANNRDYRKQVAHSLPTLQGRFDWNPVARGYARLLLDIAQKEPRAR